MKNVANVTVGILIVVFTVMMSYNIYQISRLPSNSCGCGTTCKCSADIPPCKCGCMETGQCQCKNCAERTADPSWKK